MDRERVAAEESASALKDRYTQLQREITTERRQWQDRERDLSATLDQERQAMKVRIER